jgi:hypothetical protein
MMAIALKGDSLFEGSLLFAGAFIKDQTFIVNYEYPKLRTVANSRAHCLLMRCP